MNREGIIQNIINDLRGTRQDFFIVIEKYGLKENDLSLNDLLQIDANIFCCYYCGSWFDNSEMGEMEDEIGICQNCSQTTLKRRCAR